ncbi:LysM domain-containing protein [Verrucomicrobium sp. 3C]|uniref:LysM peptidoglycan-binding domain-containing protein n=1 Tax=Verrucomicrobium sp. 3C TaxID=1134055 RepID=UPI00037E484A|nr:LysM domain-containing protein [Verrucomicrobium sp. 3C]
MATRRPNSTGIRRFVRRIPIACLWTCLSLHLAWNGRLLAQEETPEVIRQQDEEEARRKVLRASDTLDQIEGTVEGHTRELQRLQQELSQLKEELRNLHGVLSQTAASSPPSTVEPKKGTSDGQPTHAHPPDPGPAHDAPRTKVVSGYYYKVQAGDTVSAIAEAYRQSGVPVTAEQIRAANGLSRRESLHPGQKIFVPKGAGKKKRTSSTPPAPASP